MSALFNNEVFWLLICTWWVMWTQAREIDKLSKRVRALGG